MDPVIVIPAVEPDGALVDLVAGLRARSPFALVVVDDGSTGRTAPIFQDVAAVPGCTVLIHPRNLGKGRALRTALAHVLAVHPGAPGVVTADADGQHAVEDVLRVTGCLLARPHALILGVRQFTRDVPARNRIGNGLGRRAVRLVTGVDLSDTQTGLRGIPAAWLPELIALRTERYAFEMEMLLWAYTRSVEIVEQPIRTLYAGRVSHFAPVVDSLRVGLILARFAASSLRRRSLSHAPDDHALRRQVSEVER